MLATLGVIDSNVSSVIWLNTHDVQPRLPYHVDFQVHVECLNNIIKRTIVDEGVATSMMSISCWQGIGSPTLYISMTTLTSFNGCSFRLHGIIPSL